MEKLFLITRSDLPEGDRAMQMAHAFREFIEQHPEIDRAWYKNSNTLVGLEIGDEKALAGLLEEARWKGIPASPFHEPDRGNELTAIALGPTGKRLCRRLPKAFSPAGRTPGPSEARPQPAG